MKCKSCYRIFSRHPLFSLHVTPFSVVPPFISPPIADRIHFTHCNGPIQWSSVCLPLRCPSSFAVSVLLRLSSFPVSVFLPWSSYAPIPCPTSFAVSVLLRLSSFTRVRVTALVLLSSYPVSDFPCDIRVTASFFLFRVRVTASVFLFRVRLPFLRPC